MPVRIHSMNGLRARFRDLLFRMPSWSGGTRRNPAGFQGARCKGMGREFSNTFSCSGMIQRYVSPYLLGAKLRTHVVWICHSPDVWTKIESHECTHVFWRFPQMYDIILEEIKATAALVLTEGTVVSKNDDFAYHLLLLFSCFATAPGKLEEGNFHVSI